MSDQKARAWVERLLRGDIRSGDLGSLFLYARDRADGRDTVREIGDFVAHQTERSKGIITREARNWLALVIFHLPIRMRPESPVDINTDRLPPIAPAYFRAALDRLDDRSLRQTAKMTKAQAYEILKDLIPRLSKNSDGTYACQLKTPEEWRVIEYVSSHMNVKPAFDGDHLSKGIMETLRSANVLSRQEARNNPQLHRLFQLFAISVMHNGKVLAEGYDPIRLYAAIGESGIAINAAIPALYVVPHSSINIASAMFTTTLHQSDSCETELLENHEWTRNIEVMPNGLLGYLS